MFEKKTFSLRALHGCRHSQLFPHHHPQRACCQERVPLSVGVQDITASSSVPWSCLDVRTTTKKSTYFSHVDFKLLNLKRCREDIWSYMTHSLSQSLPVIQVGSVWGRSPHLCILWGYFLLLKHLSWAQTKRKQVQGTVPILSLWPGSPCLTRWSVLVVLLGDRYGGACNPKHTMVPLHIFIRRAKFWRDFSNISCSQAIFRILSFCFELENNSNRLWRLWFKW